MEVAGYLARAAADIAHRPAAAHLLREAVQQGAIQRLVRQFAQVVRRIRGGDTIVACLNRGRLSLHKCPPPCALALSFGVEIVAYEPIVPPEPGCYKA